MSRRKTFFQFVVAHCDRYQQSTKGAFANRMAEDHAFPKQACDFDQISDYLELSGLYVEDMSVFDELWHIYEVETAD